MPLQELYLGFLFGRANGYRFVTASLREAATSSEQRAEPLLAEVLIVGQDVREAANPHHGHGSAVGETVPLIRPTLAENERVEERVVGLNNHLHRAIFQNRPYGQRGDLAELAPSFGEKGEKLGQHLLSRHQTPRGERAGYGAGRGVPLIAWVVTHTQ